MRQLSFFLVLFFLMMASVYAPAHADYWSSQAAKAKKPWAKAKKALAKLVRAEKKTKAGVSKADAGLKAAQKKYQQARRAYLLAKKTRAITKRLKKRKKARLKKLKKKWNKTKNAVKATRRKKKAAHKKWKSSLKKLRAAKRKERKTLGKYKSKAKWSKKHWMPFAVEYAKKKLIEKNKSVADPYKLTAAQINGAAKEAVRKGGYSSSFGWYDYYINAEFQNYAAKPQKIDSVKAKVRKANGTFPEKIKLTESQINKITQTAVKNAGAYGGLDYYIYSTLQHYLPKRSHISTYSIAQKMIQNGLSFDAAVKKVLGTWNRSCRQR